MFQCPKKLINQTLKDFSLIRTKLMKGISLANEAIETHHQVAMRAEREITELENHIEKAGKMVGAIEQHIDFGDTDERKES